MASTYRARPSELLGIDDGWAAYQLDRAVMLAGGHIQSKVDKAEAEAIRGKGDPGKAVRRALEEALTPPAVRERRAAARTARAGKFRYHLTPAGARVEKVA